MAHQPLGCVHVDGWGRRKTSARVKRKQNEWPKEATRHCVVNGSDCAKQVWSPGHSRSHNRELVLRLLSRRSSSVGVWVSACSEALCSTASYGPLRSRPCVVLGARCTKGANPGRDLGLPQERHQFYHIDDKPCNPKRYQQLSLRVLVCMGASPLYCPVFF